MKMKVKDLILALETMPKDAYIVIDNQVVQNIEWEEGRYKDHIMGSYWLPIDRGSKDAVRFTKLVELSDGSLTDVKF